MARRNARQRRKEQPRAMPKSGHGRRAKLNAYKGRQQTAYWPTRAWVPDREGKR